VVEVLNTIYKADFLGFSYAFRPGRGRHDALDTPAVGIESQAVNWILDADIKGFFDNISHEWLMRFAEHRVGDQRALRLLRKWLTAGVAEDGVRQPAAKGTPQGRSFRRCWRTSISITLTIYGSTNGGNAMRKTP
jgi:RNA-directed DNA polymerase